MLVVVERHTRLTATPAGVLQAPDSLFGSKAPTIWARLNRAQRLGRILAVIIANAWYWYRYVQYLS